MKINYYFFFIISTFIYIAGKSSKNEYCESIEYYIIKKIYKEDQEENIILQSPKSEIMKYNAIFYLNSRIIHREIFLHHNKNEIKFSFQSDGSLLETNNEEKFFKEYKEKEYVLEDETNGGKILAISIKEYKGNSKRFAYKLEIKYPRGLDIQEIYLLFLIPYYIDISNIIKVPLVREPGVIYSKLIDYENYFFYIISELINESNLWQEKYFYIYLIHNILKTNNINISIQDILAKIQCIYLYEDDKDKFNETIDCIIKYILEYWFKVHNKNISEVISIFKENDISSWKTIIRNPENSESNTIVSEFNNTLSDFFFQEKILLG